MSQLFPFRGNYEEFGVIDDPRGGPILAVFPVSYIEEEVVENHAPSAVGKA